MKTGDMPMCLHNQCKL